VEIVGIELHGFRQAREHLPHQQEAARAAQQLEANIGRHDSQRRPPPTLPVNDTLPGVCKRAQASERAAQQA
jgi:hypothetical protein